MILKFIKFIYRFTWLKYKEASRYAKQFNRSPFFFLRSKSFLFFLFKIKKDKMPFPFYIQVEPTTRCNLKCPYCTRNSYSKEDLKSDIDINSILNFIKKSPLRVLKIQGMGEPFAYKYLEEICIAAKRKNIALETTTNGTTLLRNPDHIHILINYFDIVNISIDAGNKETFELNRVGAKYEDVLEGIKILVNKRNETKSRLRIRAAFVLTESNYNEIPDFVKTMKQIGVESCGFPEVENWKIPTDLDYEIYSSYYVNYIEKRPQIQKFIKSNFSTEEIHEHGLDYQLYRGKRKGNCDWMFYKGFITESGNLTPCCIRMENKYSIEKNKSIIDNDFEESWNTGNAAEFRQSHLNNTPNVYCDNCPG